MDRRSFLVGFVASLATKQIKRLPIDTSLLGTEISTRPPWSDFTFQQIYDDLVDQFCSIYQIPKKYVTGRSADGQFLKISAQQIFEHQQSIGRVYGFKVDKSTKNNLNFKRR